MSANQLTYGQRVEYVGDVVNRLIGQRGRFLKISPQGWAEVDFDKFGNVGPLKVAPENLRTVED